MSRVGNKPIEIKEGVTVTVNGQDVIVKGPRGELSLTLRKGITAKADDGKIVLKTANETVELAKLHGLSRTLISNMVEGVSDGFLKRLEFNGVGYRANVEGSDLILNLGYSHPIKYTPREGIEIKVEKNVITISGIDKQLVGQTAAEIREFRKPEPYKGKGIKYEDEHIRRKAGKAAVKGE
ncbi:MAG: 50S ribosomal protein L6 [Patescibacteria group bacterium]|nr:50S ribosomal protein L6 [Patescibacteria group bacterium]